LLDELADEEDAYLLTAMEEVKDEPAATREETAEFERWLKASIVSSNISKDRP
jgi:hypothetical protein